MGKTQYNATRRYLSTTMSCLQTDFHIFKIDITHNQQMLWGWKNVMSDTENEIKIALLFDPHSF